VASIVRDVYISYRAKKYSRSHALVARVLAMIEPVAMVVPVTPRFCVKTAEQIQHFLSHKQSTAVDLLLTTPGDDGGRGRVLPIVDRRTWTKRNILITLGAQLCVQHDGRLGVM